MLFLLLFFDFNFMYLQFTALNFSRKIFWSRVSLEVFSYGGKLVKSVVGVQFVMQFLDVVPVLIIDSYLHLHQLWQITVSNLTI